MTDREYFENETSRKFLPGYTFNLVGGQKDLEIVHDIENYFQRPMEEITVDQIPGLVTDEDE